MQNKKEKLKAAINLINLMPPSKIKKNQIGLINLAPIIEQNLLQKIDLPHTLQLDTHQNQYFIKTQFNRDGDSYRSPYSNKYFPAQQDAYFPTQYHRQLQIKANALFKQYTKLYYEGGVGNFFVSSSEQQRNFSCGFFAKKQCDPSKGVVGNWDSFNIVDIKFEGNKVIYKLNTTILIEMKISSNKVGEIDLSGFLRKNKQEAIKIPEKTQQIEFHISNIGRIIQQMETNMRNQIQAIYISKTKHIIFTTRFQNTRQSEENLNKLANSLINLKSKPSSE